MHPQNNTKKVYKYVSPKVQYPCFVHFVKCRLYLLYSASAVNWAAFTPNTFVVYKFFIKYGNNN